MLVHDHSKLLFQDIWCLLTSTGTRHTDAHILTNRQNIYTHKINLQKFLKIINILTKGQLPSEFSTHIHTLFQGAFSLPFTKLALLASPKTKAHKILLRVCIYKSQTTSTSGEGKRICLCRVKKKWVPPHSRAQGSSGHPEKSQASPGAPKITVHKNILPDTTVFRRSPEAGTPRQGYTHTLLVRRKGQARTKLILIQEQLKTVMERSNDPTVQAAQQKKDTCKFDKILSWASCINTKSQ